MGGSSDSDTEQKAKKKDKKERKDKDRKSSKHDGRVKDKKEDRDRDRERRDQDKAVADDRHRRDRERDKERGRGERERDRDRVQDRNRDRDRVARRTDGRRDDRDRDRDRGRRDRSRSRDRRDGRRDGSRDGRGRRRSRSPAGAERDSNRRKELTSAERKQALEDEQSQLDAEAERRRARVAAWQEAKRKAEAEAAGAQGADQEQAGTSKKGWDFDRESDDDDDEEMADGIADGQTEGAAEGDGAVAVAGATENGAAPRANGVAAGAPKRGRRAVRLDDVEDDPFEAFMRQNLESLEQDGAADGDTGDAGMAEVKQEGAVAGTGPEVKVEEEEEVDPLDAFMAAEIVPELKKAFKPVITAQQTEVITTKQEAGEGPGPAAPAAEAPKTITNGAATAAPTTSKRKRSAIQYSDSDADSGAEDEEEPEEYLYDDMDDEQWAKAVRAGRSKGDKLGAVDHTAVEYEPFRRKFYIEVPDLARLTEEEVGDLRTAMDDIKIRGKEVPKPIRNWNQAGLSSKIIAELHKAGFAAPMPIQAQALPVIMSGRDCIGIAKTGSGKTLAYLLPMLRHVKDQRPLEPEEGPIGLIMAPTRELVVQIGKEAKRFCKLLGLVTVCVYGGAGIGQQIGELKRGAEIVACTPGRFIDILSTSGKVTNLRRVTFFVLDEADRMFDMGFEPQIMRVVNNVRPDRQTVMFSATFPKQVEMLARQVLGQAPVEILVGGRSVVNSDITQFIEVRPEEDRFSRLLEILGQYYEQGKVIIFVHSQERADNLFRDLLRSGYPVLSLHGGKDQLDRESTLSDFKGDVCNLLVATSIAARGLDVKELCLVVNYDCPNHHEDYVHRVGRTGRAGRKGTAITFISPDEEQYAPDLVKALQESGATVPQDLQALADEFSRKRKAGLVQGHGSGFGGSGFKFNALEDEARKAQKKAAAKELGYGEEEEDEEDKESARDAARELTERQEAKERAAAMAVVEAPELPADMSEDAVKKVQAAQAMAAKLAQAAAAAMEPEVSAPFSGVRKKLVPVSGGPAPGPAVTPALAPALGGLQGPPGATAAPINPLVAAAMQAANAIAAQKGLANVAAAAPSAPLAGAARAAALAAQFAGVNAPAAAVATAMKEVWEAELEINEFPQHARWKVTHRETLEQIHANTGASVFTRGVFVPPGTKPPEGDRRLYLLIEGPNEISVKRGKAECKRVLEEYTEKSMRRDAATVGRYVV